MKKRLYLFIAITLLVLPAATVQGSILFQQTSDNFLGYYSDIPAQQIADDFSISSGGTITGVKWTGGYYNGLFSPDSFTLRFYSNNSGSPGSLLASYAIGSAAGKTDTGLVFSYSYTDAVEVYKYDYTLSSSFNAVAGTTYWISILNGDTNNWIWADMDRTNLAADRTGDSGSWSASNIGNRAFELDGGGTSAVPEPATMLLLGLGLAGVAVARKKFQK